jgi:hypothetical protein
MAALPPGKSSQYPGGLDDVENREFLTPSGLELQPVASRYTDYAIPAPVRTGKNMV